MVHGEPGIGKTRLLDAVASSAAGFDVVRLIGGLKLAAICHRRVTPLEVV